MTLNKFSSTKTILVALLLNLITLVFAQDNSTRVIHIASPSAGDVYQAGSHLFVSWSIYPTSGFITAINLYRGDPRKKQQESQLIAIIATDVEAMKGSFNWMIPDALPTAKDYIVSIEYPPEKLTYSGQFTVNASANNEYK